jgi:hypothetical protein
MSWALEAIEREAMRRASLKLMGDLASDPTFRLFGMSINQIRIMRHEWMKANPGKEPSEIDTMPQRENGETMAAYTQRLQEWQARQQKVE